MIVRSFHKFSRLRNLIVIISAEEDEIHLRTKYLFDDDKDMTPLSQMQATKTLLNGAQRIAYVGLCRLVTREIVEALLKDHFKELTPAAESAKNWATKVMGRLYYHMEITPEGKTTGSVESI